MASSPRRLEQPTIWVSYKTAGEVRLEGGVSSQFVEIFKCFFFLFLKHVLFTELFFTGLGLGLLHSTVYITACTVYCLYLVYGWSCNELSESLLLC